MKINRQQQRTNQLRAKNNSPRAISLNNKESLSFGSELDRQNRDDLAQYLTEKAKQIFEQGQLLAKKIDIYELGTYRRLIAEFINEAVNGSTQYMKDSFLDRRGKRRVYAIVKKVNEELDLLTQEVLNNEKDNLKIVDSIQGIKGLVLDLLL